MQGIKFSISELNYFSSKSVNLEVVKEIEEM